MMHDERSPAECLLSESYLDFARQNKLVLPL